MASPLPVARRAAPLLLALLTACGDSTPGEASKPPEPAAAAPPAVAAQHALPEVIEVPDPTRPILEMGFVEDDSEEVANQFVELADKLRRRDFAAAAGWIADDFAGHALDGLAVKNEVALPLSARRLEFDVASAPIVGAAGFLDAIRARITPWSRMEAVIWKVKAANFEAGTPRWGKIRFKATFLGDEDGGPRSLVAWAQARVERRRGRWQLVRYALESLTAEERARPLFTDVATSVGVAHTGIRFGKPGNDSFAWNGAAAGDVDGDGRWDLFVPSRPRNFLYVARADGTFAEVGEERGVARPGGGTGAVFFDFDHDGDQDLALGDVGWGDAETGFGGNPLRFFVNDGEGAFTERGAELGFGDRTHAYSLVVLDYDSDSWPDVFVCNYGRVEGEPNDSWVDARNGTPNKLFRNLEGQGFRDVAAEVGLVDTRWTYAAAAADPDGDGDPDLYVANDYGPNSFWVNRDGRFTDVANEVGLSDLGNGMGAAWGDLNGDGSLDLYVENMSSTAGNRILSRLEHKDDTVESLLKMAAGNSIFFQNGMVSVHLQDAPQFERAAVGGTGGSWAWSAAVSDLDLDGRLDVYCASGFVTGDTAADT